MSDYAMLQWPFGEITGRVTASHREPDGTLVIDAIEIATVDLAELDEPEVRAVS